MAGRFMDEMPGMSFGHAGTIVEGKEDTATEKIARMQAAGITIAERIEDIPELVNARGSAWMSLFIDVEVAPRSRPTRRWRPSWPRSARSTSTPRTPTAALRIVEPNLDECVLCRLCIDAAPPAR